MGQDLSSFFLCRGSRTAPQVCETRGTGGTLGITRVSSSSSDEAVTSASPYPPVDFRHFQNLLQRVAEMLQIPLEEVKEAPPQTFRCPTELGEAGGVVWHTLPTYVTNPKKAEEKTFCPRQGGRRIFISLLH